MSKHSQPILTITEREARALMAPLHEAQSALRCLAAMHAAAHLSTAAAQSRKAARSLAAFGKRLGGITPPLRSNGEVPCAMTRTHADAPSIVILPS